VYFCPLSINNNHFTLLEINEREKKIYRYNSMAGQDIIDGTVKLIRVDKIVLISEIHDQRPNINIANIISEGIWLLKFRIYQGGEYCSSLARQPSLPFLK
jgi:hypothetical protein